MAKKIKQFRYYGENHELNYPPTITKGELHTGRTFSLTNNAYIQALGIQAIPGTKFFINSGKTYEPIIIGASGIFELSLADGYEVKTLNFDLGSLDLIDDPTNGAYLIVDAIYNDVEG